MFPWNKNIQVDLKKCSQFCYQKGFYGTFSGESVGIGGINFCFDTIVFKSNNEILESNIKVNTRIFSFDKIIKEIKERGILQDVW